MRDVAGDLEELYDQRLVRVLVFGTRARRQDDEESAVDVLVVLADLDSSWEELRRMDDVLWKHVETHGSHRWSRCRRSQ